MRSVRNKMSRVAVLATMVLSTAAVLAAAAIPAAGATPTIPDVGNAMSALSAADTSLSWGPSPSRPGESGSTAVVSSSHVIAQLHTQALNGQLTHGRGTVRVCPYCDSSAVTTGPHSTSLLRTTTPAGLGPADLDTAFHLPTTSSGPETTVAIIDAGVDPHLDADLAHYRTQYHLPACRLATGCLRTIDYHGGAQPGPPTSGPAGPLFNEELAEETSLDLDAASAACPSCRLLEISLPWQLGFEDNDLSYDAFATATQMAVVQGAKVVSISYGYTPTYHNTSGPTLAALTHHGVAILASTGDSGYNGPSQQSWPSALPGVIAVGGTQLNTGNTQTAWSDAGSGCSSYFPAAEGQPASISSLCGGHRAAADISADASPNSGYAVYDTWTPTSPGSGGWTVIGGTSGSTPFIGGLFARANDLSTVAGPATLYKAPPTSLHDITTGTNGTCSGEPGISTRLCKAGPGWDGPTGIGIPWGLGAFHIH